MPVGTTYYDHYINKAKLNSASITDTLTTGLDSAILQLGSIPHERWGYRYAPEKWSIKELVQHIIDTERVFCGRALAFARGEEQNLPGFDQDVYVQNSFADYRDHHSLIAEYKAVRQSTILLFAGFSSSTLQKTGTANNVGFTVEEIGYILAGHELHHIEVLQQKYL